MRSGLDESAQSSSGLGARRVARAPSTGVTLVVASLIHLAAGAWLLHVRASAPSPVVEEETTFVIDMPSETPLEDVPSDSDPISGSVAPRPSRRGAIGSLSLDTGRAQGTATESSALPDGAGVVVAEGDGMSRPLGSIHGGFQQTDLDGTPEAQSGPTLSERGTKTLRDALYARDTSLGLGADGPVLQALTSSAQASTAPVEGRAVFDVVVGSDGFVTSLTVSEGGLAWSGVAKDALDAVRGKKARVPSSATKGVAIKVELTSRNLLPSGHSPNTQLSVGGIPLTKKGDDKAVKVSILNPIPKIVLVPLDPQGNVMVPMAYVEIFGTNVDPTDIDARPRRVIASKVLTENLL